MSFVPAQRGKGLLYHYGEAGKFFARGRVERGFQRFCRVLADFMRSAGFRRSSGEKCAIFLYRNAGGLNGAVGCLGSWAIQAARPAICKFAARPAGTFCKVRGQTAAVDRKAFVQDGLVRDRAPDLMVVTIAGTLAEPAIAVHALFSARAELDRGEEAL